MRVHRDQLATRIPGTLLGMGFVAIGAYAVFGAGDDLAPYARDRALWFGLTAIFAGVCAIAVSWLVGRLDNIWCAPPRRGFLTRRAPPP